MDFNTQALSQEHQLLYHRRYLLLSERYCIVISSERRLCRLLIFMSRRLLERGPRHWLRIPANSVVGPGCLSSRHRWPVSPHGEISQVFITQWQKPQGSSTQMVEPTPRIPRSIISFLPRREKGESLGWKYRDWPKH